MIGRPMPFIPRNIPMLAALFTALYWMLVIAGGVTLSVFGLIVLGIIIEDNAPARGRQHYKRDPSEPPAYDHEEWMAGVMAEHAKERDKYLDEMEQREPGFRAIWEEVQAEKAARAD
jgi:hypothetical protein